MRRPLTAVTRVVVLIALYAVMAQTMLAQASPPALAGSQICDKTSAGDKGPVHDAACGMLSCCLSAGSAWTLSPPILAHAPLRFPQPAAWTKAGTRLFQCSIIRPTYATGPPLILTEIAI